jgi:hypothetical protein
VSRPGLFIVEVLNYYSLSSSRIVGSLTSNERKFGVDDVMWVFRLELCSLFLQK